MKINNINYINHNILHKKPKEILKRNEANVSFRLSNGLRGTLLGLSILGCVTAMPNNISANISSNLSSNNRSGYITECSSNLNDEISSINASATLNSLPSDKSTVEQTTLTESIEEENLNFITDDEIKQAIWDVLNNEKSKTATGLFMQISKYEQDGRNFFDDLNNLNERDKEKTIKIIIEKINNEAEQENTVLGIARCLNNCYYSPSESSKNFVGSFIADCSDNAFVKFVLSADFSKRNNDYEDLIKTRLTSLRVSNLNYDTTVSSNQQSNKIGDCWLLAGLGALGAKECGQKVIEEAIEQTNDGYNVKLFGLDKEFEISNEELLEALSSKEYSTGNAVSVLFELAFEKAAEQTTVKYGTKEDVEHKNITMGTFNSFIKALLGRKVNTETKNFQNALQILSYDNVVGTVNFNSYNSGEARYLTDINGKTHLVSGEGDSMHASHMLSIISVDSKNDIVTLANPWNARKEIIVSTEELTSNATSISYAIL